MKSENKDMVGWLELAETALALWHYHPCVFDFV